MIFTGRIRRAFQNQSPRLRVDRRNRGFFLDLLPHTRNNTRNRSCFRPSRSSTHQKISPGSGQRATRTSHTVPASTVECRSDSRSHGHHASRAIRTIFSPLLLRFVQAAAAAPLGQFPRPPTHLHRPVPTPACSSSSTPGANTFLSWASSAHVCALRLSICFPFWGCY